MVADDDDITTHGLPDLISIGELLCKEMDRMHPLQLHKVVVADYVGVTGYKRQHVHRDMRHVPLGSCTIYVFGAIKRDITQNDASESYFMAESTHGNGMQSAFACTKATLSCCRATSFTLAIVSPSTSSRTLAGGSSSSASLPSTSRTASPAESPSLFGPRSPLAPRGGLLATWMGVEQKMSLGSVFHVVRVPFVASMFDTSALGAYPVP